MQVKCDLCERIDQIDANSLLAKRLLHQKVHSYLCEDCSNRIASKTHERYESGKFRLYCPKTNRLEVVKRNENEEECTSSQ